MHSDQVTIHPTAVVHETAVIGPGTVLDAYAVVQENTQVGANCHLHSFATVGPNTTLGDGNIVYHHASVGADPQDLSFVGQETWLEVGEKNRIREFVTINRGTSKGDGYTRVGDGGLFMACSHIAHDCIVGDGVILANNALLAGHVTVQDRAIVNGAAGVQQFTTIGELSYVGGLTRIVHDVPPFMVVEGNPSKVRKVNTVGLQRAGFSDEAIQALKEAHRKIFRSRRPRAQILDEVAAGMEITPEVNRLIAFLREAQQGHHGRSREV